MATTVELLGSVEAVVDAGDPICASFLEGRNLNF